MEETLLEWLEEYDTLSPLEQDLLLHQLDIEKNYSLLTRIQWEPRGEPPTLTHLVFTSSSANAASLFFRLGYSLYLIEVSRYLEHSIQRGQTSMTALLLEYKYNTFSQEEWDIFEERKVLLAFQLCQPTLEEWGLSWVHTTEPDNSITLHQYFGTETQVCVPSTMDGHPVRGLEIPEGCLLKTFNLFPITQLELEEGVRLLSPLLFAGSQLEEIVLNKGMTTIPDFSFADTLLQELVIPDGVVSIGKSVCRDCNQLETLQLPNSVQSIGDRSFFKTNIETLVLPDNLTSLGVAAFMACVQLKTITFGSSPLSVDTLCFCGCRHLKMVFLTDEWNITGGKLFDYCPNLHFIGKQGGENQLKYLRSIGAVR